MNDDAEVDRRSVKHAYLQVADSIAAAGAHLLLPNTGVNPMCDDRGAPAFPSLKLARAINTLQALDDAIAYRLARSYSPSVSGVM
ncbi:MAG TPA: hypothetical protein VFQ44_26285 [Streptosporangiaceae bacterium]|nr:hypothetical protein [Streptosporangiaceae bacterium]